MNTVQHQRLGDHCLNSANATHRHNAALAAVHRALTSVTSDTLPVGSIQLADKGDGTPASKAERMRYYAHVNKGHIPDMVRFRALQLYSALHLYISTALYTLHPLHPPSG